MVVKIPVKIFKQPTKTLFIPCAGRGSRIVDGQQGLPKPLSTIGGVPAVGRIISYYPEDFDIVIALGFESEIVRAAIEAMFYDNGRINQISFSYTDSYKNSGQGLSHTILDARDRLSERPFIFHAVDSILDEQLFKSHFRLEENNQVLFSRPKTPGHYRFAQIMKDGQSTWGSREFNDEDKESCYIGVSHIWDYEVFWENLGRHGDESPEAGETLGLNLADAHIAELPSSAWFDVGNKTGLLFASEKFPNTKNILQKQDEAIWFINSNVIKIHKDKNFIEGRVQRAKKLLPFVPKIEYSNQYTYLYKEITGLELSKALQKNNFNFSTFFNYLWKFWMKNQLKAIKLESHFNKDYLKFYYDKTVERIMRLRKRFPEIEDPCQINGISVQPISRAIERVDWKKLSQIASARIHGDLHPENILMTDDDDFILLDWRQDLAGSRTAEGDIYYDIGKFIHGLRVDHGIVANKEYSVVETEDGGTEIQIAWAPGKEIAFEKFRIFITSKNLSWNRALLMEAIIYLNIACLHEPDEYSIFLAHLGRMNLQLILDSEQSLTN